MTDDQDHVDHTPPRPPDLVLAAFDQARARGKPEWWRMTSPVLKNRMLQLDPDRLEELVGQRTFRVWLEDQDSLIVTPDGNHAIIELPESARATLDGPSATLPVGERAGWRGLRLRPDLWRAVMDYDSGYRYVWNAETQSAVAAAHDDPRPGMPTFTSDELRALRTSFSASVRDADLTEWVSSTGRTDDLPRRHRGSWNETLKKAVAERLQRWFQEADIAPAPPILVHAPATPEPTEVARALMQSLASSMTASELEHVQVPLGAIARLWALSGRA